MNFFLPRVRLACLGGVLLLYWSMLTLTVQGQGFVRQISGDPFAPVSISGPGSSPSLADLDGDGDLDLVITNFDGTIQYYTNTGVPPQSEQTVFVGATSPLLPPSGSSIQNLKFSFGDLDGDGDLDAVTGGLDGIITPYINNGTKTNPIFAQSSARTITAARQNTGARVAALFNDVSYPNEGYAYVSLADFDADGDLDMLVITSVAIHYLRNVGSSSAANFQEITGCDNPFYGIIRSGNYANPVVGDLDGDGDLDVALSGVPILYYRNIGTPSAPRFVQIVGEANPFDGIDLGFGSQLELGDLDKDGDLDAVAGQYSGSASYIKNVIQVTQQPTPANVVTCVGSSVSTTVQADGDGTVYYQWYRHAQTTDAPIYGQTSATLQLYNVQASDAGVYYAQISSGGGTLFSDAFNLVVQKAAITQQPASTSNVAVGTNVVVPVLVSGPITNFQWYRNGQPAANQNTPTLTLNSVTPGDAGSYVLVATSPCNSVTSSAFSLSVSCSLAPPTLAASTLSTTNEPISVTASGCSGGTINWQPLGGTGTANGSIYTFSQPGNYTLTATCTQNGCTSSVSNAVTLSIQGGTFAITTVNTLNCELFDAVKGGYYVTFAPQYTGQNSKPISFSVVNEKLVTSDPPPYTIRLYTDNPAITLVASQQFNNETNFRYEWWAGCQSGSTPNNPPTTSGIADQTILLGQPYQLDLKNYFSDPDLQSLTFAAQGLPAGLNLSGSVISGTPTSSGTSPVSITATDPGGLSANASFQLTVTSGSETSEFTITGVSTINCEYINASSRRVTFNPQYAGVTGEPISFSIVSEKAPTTNPGPYTLDLYTDNPTITLSAKQGSTSTTYAYNWLNVCFIATRIGVIESDKKLQVRVLGNPVSGKSIDVEISGVSGQAVQVELLDLQGKQLHHQSIQEAGSSDRVSVPLGYGRGLLMLQVHTEKEHQQVKLVKP
jgi:hypothetical protein